jgi:hypothetical protein
VRFADDLINRSLLDRAPAAHHDDPLGHARHDGEVVADEQECHVALRDEPVEQSEDLVLHGDVEGCGRLVRDQQSRARGEGDRGGDALPLPAGELVRERLGEPGVGESHIVECGVHGVLQRFPA